MDETKHGALRLILKRVEDQGITVDFALQEILQYYIRKSPKIPVYHPDEVADALEHVGENDGVLDLKLKGE